ncbi:MAG: 30S ribosomal protein S8 [Deltaproteobacteria bacterium]|nr:30S ribosomal protein S8 [Deltaproteobacteria bacterium]
MGVSDPVADMLTRIRNANRMRFKSVDVLVSKTNISIVKVLKKEGFIGGYDVRKDHAGSHNVLRVYLKYTDSKEKVITDIQRISKPSKRVYVKSKKIPKILDGYGIAILSTSRGIITDKEARVVNAGGEILCSVW